MSLKQYSPSSLRTAGGQGSRQTQGSHANAYTSGQHTPVAGDPDYVSNDENRTHTISVTAKLLLGRDWLRLTAKC